MALHLKINTDMDTYLQKGKTLLLLLSDLTAARLVKVFFPLKKYRDKIRQESFHVSSTEECSFPDGSTSLS